MTATMTPEFSRPERVERIGADERTVEIVADERERAALATRFGLLAVDRLAARFALARDAAGVLATGRVEAAAIQPCAATGAPLAVVVDEPVVLRFAAEAPGEDELELSAEALDTLPIENGAIDLGEAAAQTLALALDPFARAPDADAALREAGVLKEGEEGIGPFAALAALKDRLGD